MKKNCSFICTTNMTENLFLQHSTITISSVSLVSNSEWNFLLMFILQSMKVSLIINVSHNPWLDLKGTVLFLAYSFASDIMASLATGNHSFINLLKQRPQSQYFSLSLVQKKLSIHLTRKEPCFYILSMIYKCNLLHIFYQLHSFQSCQHIK